MKRRIYMASFVVCTIFMFAIGLIVDLLHLRAGENSPQFLLVAIPFTAAAIWLGIGFLVWIIYVVPQKPIPFIDYRPKNIFRKGQTASKDLRQSIKEGHPMKLERQEKLLIIAIVLLLINILVAFRPYQIIPGRSDSAGMVAVRLNTYTGKMTAVWIFGEADLPMQPPKDHH